MSEPGSDRPDVQACDWECRDCGVVWTVRDSVAEDATLADLPEYCPECGDTPGWGNLKTGRKVPEPLTDGGQPTAGSEQTTIEETTVTVVEETSAHRRFEVPASDVGEDEVSLANAELVDEGIHGDPLCYRRKDTNEDVEVSDR